MWCMPTHCWILRVIIISLGSVTVWDMHPLSSFSKRPAGTQHNQHSLSLVYRTQSGSHCSQRTAAAVAASDESHQNRPRRVVCVMSSESVSLWCGSKIISSKEISREKGERKAVSLKVKWRLEGKQYTRAHRLAPGTAQRPHCHGSPGLCTHFHSVLGETWHLLVILVNCRQSDQTPSQGKNGATH